MPAQLDCLFKSLVAECTLPHLLTVLIYDKLSLLIHGLDLLLFLLIRLLSFRQRLLNWQILNYLLISSATFRPR